MAQQPFSNGDSCTKHVTLERERERDREWEGERDTKALGDRYYQKYLTLALAIYSCAIEKVYHFKKARKNTPAEAL